LSNRFTTVGDPVVLPTETRRQILNLFQESLNNIEKYAQAQHLNISLIWLENCLPTTVPTDGHFGLMMMRELVKSMKGHFEIDSSPGQGTRLNFKIPLPNVQPGLTSDQTWPINSYSFTEQPLQAE
jgi:signal transduction histidine kinase